MFLVVGSVCFFEVCDDVFVVGYVYFVEYIVDFGSYCFIFFGLQVENCDFDVFGGECVSCGDFQVGGIVGDDGGNGGIEFY